MISKLIQVTAAIIIFIGISYATTFHVSKNGNDSSNGLDWDNAWETLNKVDSTTLISAGDTVFFATGTWRGSFDLVGGTFGNHTIYACSAFADTNGDGDWHFAKIYGSIDFSDSVWVQHSGNVYKGVFESLTHDAGLCAQGTNIASCDSLLWLRSSLGAVDTEGEWYISSNNDTVYVYMWDLGSGYDPNSYHIEMAISTFQSGSIILIDDYDASHTTLYGLQFKYVAGRMISFYDSPNSDSVFIERCKLSHVTAADLSTNNPACIFMSNLASDYADYTTVTACSIGYAINYTTSNHGCGIQWYSGSHSVIDSNTFYGYFTGAAIQSKCSKFNEIPSEGTAIRYNTFDPTYATSGVRYLSGTVDHDSVYGNIFKGGCLAGIEYGCWHGYPPNNKSAVGLFIFNNTFYNTKGFYSFGYGDSCAANQWGIESTFVKYNVYYADSATLRIGSGSYNESFNRLQRQWHDDGDLVFDSNLFCLYEQVYIVGTDQAQDSADWAALDYDLNSNWVSNLSDIGFTNPAYGDFSRPNASTEMYRTYGGKTWSLYGAWQPDDPLPPPPDTTSPGRIEDLNAIPGNNHGEIILTWTAPGDDGDTGLADHYVIKYSPTAITESNWADFPAVLNPPQPLSPGDSTYFALDTHEDGYYYYIAIKTYDEVGNVSDLSNVAFSFSAGIMMPIQIETYIDSLSSLVTVSCELVESYKSICYLFALDSVSVYSNPEFVIDSLSNLPSDVATAVFEGLSDDVNYYWRCCAISTDYSDSSAWTPSIEFNLYFGLISSLAESDCLRPTEGEIVPSSRPYFIVRNPQDIYELYFQVDDNDNFSSPVESGSVPPTPGDETRWQLPATDPIEQGITYYWRVSNNNAVWTSPISFSALLEIHPYPNPFRASEGHTNITFTNLPQDSSIMISTISGDIILREDNIGPGDWVWDVKNDRGNNLAPGVYLYAINFPSGSSNGKILVIR